MYNLFLDFLVGSWKKVFGLPYNVSNLLETQKKHLNSLFSLHSAVLTVVGYFKVNFVPICRIHFENCVCWTNKGSFVILFQSDCMSALEKDRDYREEHFDFIQQHIRRHCLKCILINKCVFYCKRYDMENFTWCCTNLAVCPAVTEWQDCTVQ